MYVIVILLVFIIDVDVFNNRNCDNMSDCDHENVCESSIQDQSTSDVW